jgi:hypothetical protein
MDEPEIIFTSDEPTTSRATPLDLTEYTEAEFRLHYKATKRQYGGLRKSLEVLAQTYRALKEPGPLEIDPDLLSNIEYMMEDFTEILEQMHLAAEWEKEKH